MYVQMMERSYLNTLFNMCITLRPSHCVFTSCSSNKDMKGAQSKLCSMGLHNFCRESVGGGPNFQMCPNFSVIEFQEIPQNVSSGKTNFWGVNFYYDRSMLFDSIQKEVSGQSARSMY